MVRKRKQNIYLFDPQQGILYIYIFIFLAMKKNILGLILTKKLFNELSENKNVTFVNLGA